MENYVKGSDKQVVEYVMLNKIKSAISDLATKNHVAKKLLNVVDRALSMYSINKDDRYFELSRKAYDDLMFQDNIANIRYCCEVAEKKIIKIFNSWIVGFILFFAILPFILIYLPSFFVFFALIIYVAYFVFSFYLCMSYTKPLTKIISEITEFSESTYGKRVK